jgi:hypothetical protein
VSKYQRHDERYEKTPAVPCSICKVNPPTRRWEQCCMGAREEFKDCLASPPGCSPQSNRMKTCGECRAKRRAQSRIRAALTATAQPQPKDGEQR